MVRDGIYYTLAFIVVAGIVGYFTFWPLAIIPLLLAAFFGWFFRDPERQIPQTAGAIVSPGDGKVTDILKIDVNGEPRTRISIFLNVFNVHVNRSPIARVIREIRYQKGKFGNAMGAVSAEANEQNIVTVEGEGQTVVFKQIAGLLARRIVFTKKLGDTLARGERVGLIKFGSRVDVIFTSDAEVAVKIGDQETGGSTILAVARVAGSVSPVMSGSERGGVR